MKDDIDYIIDNINEDSLASIPSTATTLNLSLKNLDNKKDAELARTFAALPPKITTLNLYDNYLGKKTGVELAPAFAALPPTITNLNLYRNNLGEKTGVELARAFAALPPTIITLNLIDNHLDKKTGVELAQLFAALPPTITNLSLKFNGLDSKTGTTLTRAFAALPRKITILDLSYNKLGDRKGDELTPAFAALPRTVTNLNFKSNNLGNKTSEELAEAFAALPRTVTTLGLVSNNLGNKTAAELAQIFSAIPRGVEEIDLSGNLLLKSKTKEELESIFANIHIGYTIKIDTIYIKPTGSAAGAKKLLTKVSNHIYKEKTFIFDDIKLPQKYATDLNKFVQLIDALKKQNTAISNFTRALLITQQIEHPFTNELVNEKMNQIGYFEKAKIITSSAFYSLSNFLYNTKQGGYIADNEQCQIELCKEAISLYYAAYKEEAKQSDPNIKTMEQKEENKTPLQKVIQHLMSLLLYDMNEAIRENNEISSDYKSLIKYTNEVCEKINAGPAMASKEYNQKRLNKPSR